MVRQFHVAVARLFEATIDLWSRGRPVVGLRSSFDFSALDPGIVVGGVGGGTFSDTTHVSCFVALHAPGCSFGCVLSCVATAPGVRWTSLYLRLHMPFFIRSQSALVLVEVKGRGKSLTSPR